MTLAEQVRQPRPVLVIEDMDCDLEVVARGFQRLGVSVPLVCCRTLEEAALELRRRRADGDEPLPSIIILDLRLTDGDGCDLLMAIKQDEFLKEIPVIIWSASDDPQMVETCYREGANSYIHKSTDRVTTEQAIKQFVSFWLQTAALPRSGF